MSSSNQTATEQNLARINALNENYPEIAKNTHKAKMAESIRKAHLSGKFDDMAQAFTDRFGDKWNDDWFVEDLREFCDGIVRMSGGERLSRYMDYGRMLETMCKEENYTIWRIAEYEDGVVEWSGEDAHDFDYHEIAWVSNSPDYDKDGIPVWKCATDGMWLITNADTDLLDETDE